jgi:hypothetical protein
LPLPLCRMTLPSSSCCAVPSILVGVFAWSELLAAICAQAHTQAGIVRRGDHGARGRVHEHRRELGRERARRERGSAGGGGVADPLELCGLGGHLLGLLLRLVRLWGEGASS